MIRFHDGTSSYALRPRRGEEPGLPSEREVRSVLACWLAAEPWRAQLQRFVAHEIRVDARTDDALVDRIWALLSARGLVLSRDERMSLQDPSARLEAAEMLAEPLRAATQEDETHWIHVIVVDQDDQPLTGVRYRIELTDGRVREGRTDAEGGVYFDEIPAGKCRFTILQVGQLQSPRGRRTVRQGDCISLIAASSGMPWRTIWDAAENEPLRAAGRHPNVLLPTDEVHVPEPDGLSLATDRQHRVPVPGMVTTIHIRLVVDLEPLPDEPWVLEHPGGKLEGTSNGDGKLEAELPALLGQAILSLPKRRLRYTLRLGELDPIETRSGAQMRLRNLGLAASDRADECGQARTLLAFQRAKTIVESAKLDDATISALRKEYGI